MSEKYLGEVSTPLLINQIKENCAQKRTTLPLASIDELGHIYQYMGVTSGSLVHGYSYECVSDGQYPATYSWSQINTQPTAPTPTAATTTFDNTTSGLQATNVQGAIDEVVDGLGTAASKDFTPNVAPNNHNLVESNAVYNAITTALTSIYTPRGNLTCAELTSSLLVAANVGNIYEMSDSGTTSALFLQGAGQTIHVGDNVGIIQTGVDTYKFNLMANAFDMTDYQKKDLTQAVEGQTTVESALGALSTNKQAKTLSTSVESQTTVEGALGALSTNKATQAEVNDIVNVLGAKNLIPFPYHRQSGYTTNNATFTYDDEGVITVNKVAGNATAYFGLFSNTLYPNAEIFIVPNTSYILSMELENATDTSCFVQTQSGIDLAAIRNKATGKYEISFTTPETMDFLAVSLYYGAATTENNAKVKLMIRLASIQDDTWVPYVPTNKELMSCKLNGYVGAKNLLAYPYKHTTKSENGVTFTDNGDGTITVNTPTSASAETTFYLSQSIQSILDTGMYILSGCPSGGNRTSGYFMEFAELATSSSDWKMFGTDTGEGAIAHIDSTRYAIHAYIRIRSGATVSNLTFKPMIRRVEDTDPTWQPYAKTNRELTDVIPSDANTNNKLVVESDLKNIGDIYAASSPASISVPSNISTNLVNLTLNKGVYIVYGYILEPPSMGKTYMCMLSSVRGSMEIYTGSEVAPAASGWYAARTISSIVKVTANNSVIAVGVHQSSDSDYTYRGAHICAVKISNYTD